MRLAMEGALADKSQSLILNALIRAAAEPDGLPLLGGKTSLFAATLAGKQAAQHSKDEGLLRVVNTQEKGKRLQEVCVLTDKGLSVVMEQSNPRRLLEAFVNGLAASERQINLLLESARASQDHLQSLKARGETVLQQLQHPAQPQPLTAERNGKHDVDASAALLTYLARRHEMGSLDDCPLPELHRHAQTGHPGMTLGQFHDLLRRLHENRAIYLHPWTGPLYELPEPAFALLVGHEIAYYASLPTC
jgi:hypothetical protein